MPVINPNTTIHVQRRSGNALAKSGVLTLYKATPLAPPVATMILAFWPSEGVILAGRVNFGRQNVPLPVSLRRDGVSEMLKVG